MIGRAKKSQGREAVLEKKCSLRKKGVDKRGLKTYNRFAGSHGEMAEWFMALVLKTSDTERYRGFESLSLRHNSISHRSCRSTQEAEGAPLLRE